MLYQFLVRVGLALAIACSAFGANAQLLGIAEGETSLPLAGAALFYVDATAARSAADIWTDRSVPWKTTPQDAIHPLSTGKTLWLRFDVPPLPGEGWVLQIEYPSVNLATLFEVAADVPREIARAGDTVPVADWPVPHRYPLLPLAPEHGRARSYLLRIENPHAFSARMELVPRALSGVNEQRSTLLLGVYFGLAGLAAILAAISGVVLRDGTYARYCVAVTAMALAQAGATGVGGLLLWPHSPWWNDAAPLLLPMLAGSAFLWFFSSAVTLAKRSKVLHRAVLSLSAAGVAAAAAAAFVEPSWRVDIQVPYVALACAMGIGILTWAARRGDRHAAFMLWALLPVALSAAVPLAGAIGLLPVSAVTLHAMPIALAIELPCLLGILLMRNQARREHGRRLMGMYDIDPVTGLPNLREFQNRLARMVARSRRMGYQSAVVLVDLQDADGTHMPPGASRQQRILQLAGRLISLARDMDTVARLGDSRFGLLVEGPMTEAEAVGVGQRVVARCLMPVPGRPLVEVLRVRVAQAVAPRDGDDPVKLLAALRERFEAPGEGPVVRFLEHRHHRLHRRRAAPSIAPLSNEE